MQIDRVSQQRAMVVEHTFERLEGIYKPELQTRHPLSSTPPLDISLKDTI